MWAKHKQQQYSGFTTSDPNFSAGQGYNPSSWGNPGWKIWAGGTVTGAT